jgi:Fur family ferric uptake transcriptional regulator
MQMIRTEEILADHALEVTPARLAILDICLRSDLPLDVQAVASKLGKRSAHLATVYRTLERFVAAGILERIDFQEGKFRYEYKRSHHHHAICEGCGSVQDIENDDLASLEQKVRGESGFVVRRHTLEFFGLCNKCHQKGTHV